MNKIIDNYICELFGFGKSKKTGESLGLEIYNKVLNDAKNDPNYPKQKDFDTCENILRGKVFKNVEFQYHLCTSELDLKQYEISILYFKNSKYKNMCNGDNECIKFFKNEYAGFLRSYIEAKKRKEKILKHVLNNNSKNIFDQSNKIFNQCEQKSKVSCLKIKDFREQNVCELKLKIKCLIIKISFLTNNISKCNNDTQCIKNIKKYIYGDKGSLSDAIENLKDAEQTMKRIKK
jgi:hypothetical protein